MAQILIVDDSPLMRAELENAFAEFDVTTAEDGEKALKHLAGDDQVKLIITDMNMPIMSGLDMLEHIRSEMDNHSVKVVVMSTESNNILKQRCKELKISGWVLKPLQVDALVPVVKKLMGV